LLVLGLAVAVFAGVYVFEGGSPVGYVVVDGVRVYLVNSSVSLFVDYGGNVTVVYCGGVLWGVGPGVWFNVSLSSISIFEVYVDGVLVDRFAVKPARTSHNPFVTDLTLSLSKSRVVRGEVVSAWLSWCGILGVLLILSRCWRGGGMALSMSWVGLGGRIGSW
jgi:hypothetical protein